MASAESHVGAAHVTDHTPQSSRIDGALLKVAAAVIAGSIMAILDTTVVTIALQSLIVQFHTSFDTIQWVTTAYMLALATVIPATGWAAERFGTKRLYAFALTLFLIGSVLAGLAWDIGSMIAFRVLQGLGGGILTPAGMTILTKEAGPARVGRVMSLLGVPMLLGPLAGPILGGWLVESVSWRWIFYLNVPIGLLALGLTLRYLPRDGKPANGTFDLPGMLMLSPGVALLLYGISNIPRSDGVTLGVWVPAVLGLLLVVSFVMRANRIEHPLLDLGLFRNRRFCVAIATMAVFAVAFFGVMIVLPTYFLMVRQLGALEAGVQLLPLGLGAVVTMPMAGRLADRIGPGKVVVPGLLLISAGLGVFTQVDPSSRYWSMLAPGLFVTGLGVGATMMPIISSALQLLNGPAVARGSTTANIIQQAFGAIGSAVMAIVLAAGLASRFDVPVSQGQLVATTALADREQRASAIGLISDTFTMTFSCCLGLMVVCLIPACFLWRQPPGAGHEPVSH
ncbi:DHA2 family efflux MFS transporter permease subunit [Streptomyces sp. TLI_185]|uniref:DHA2 family efflux MFS transporter permease subunit n=1 Tax=Streptomyces sp. TLI_185 TaxID=2485151 RepID=UPI000F4E5901|nr:DHA2 family efflux MFS transporter permease subunit [Streptomyces sp. TLI_185]RPF24886.1 EmrB/QacA subfamily drug resistance transporter [Streptomyces sp. TLI_185]